MEPNDVMHFASKTNAHTAAELAERVKSLVHEYDDKIPLALALGVLRIVESELLAESD